MTVDAQVAITHQGVRLTDGSVPYVNAAFIGDSYTVGGGVTTLAKRWTSLVSQKEGWIEHNYGNGGTGYLATSSKTNAPNYLGVLDDVAASNPNVVVVAGGLNDMAQFPRDRGSVSQAITDVFTGLRNRLPDARIIAVGPSDPDGTTSSVIALDLDVQQVARAVGADYVSLLAPTPVLAANMYNPADPGHPNDLGYAAIADRFVSVVIPA